MYLAVPRGRRWPSFLRGPRRSASTTSLATCRRFHIDVSQGRVPFAVPHLRRLSRQRIGLITFVSRSPRSPPSTPSLPLFPAQRSIITRPKRTGLRKPTRTHSRYHGGWVQLRHPRHTEREPEEASSDPGHSYRFHSVQQEVLNFFETRGAVLSGEMDADDVYGDRRRTERGARPGLAGTGGAGGSAAGGGWARNRRRRRRDGPDLDSQIERCAEIDVGVVRRCLLGERAQGSVFLIICCP